MKQLHIGRGFYLPVEAVTETFAYLAKRGGGKSYNAGVVVEEMLEAGFQVVVIDPMGTWSALRTGANGKSAGYPIAVLGGDRGDIPLESTGGKVVAEMVAREHLSVVLDVSRFSKSERKRFVADFAEELYRKNRDPLHLVLEEADLFAPQRPQPGEQRMLGAIEDLVRRGRARGIGVTLITQRAAVLNKDVLTQTECLVALRTTSPQDRKAIEGWIDVVADRAERDRVLKSLPSLPIGEGWVWSPGWLELLKRVKFRKKRTFDSSATPKAGKRRVTPKTVAEVDLGVLEKRMTETIEKAKADDPKLLRKRIGELERELAKKPAAERVEVPVVDEAAINGLKRTTSRVGEAIKQAETAARESTESLKHLVDALDTLRDVESYAEDAARVSSGKRSSPRTALPAPKRSAPVPTNGDASVGQGGLRRILVALAQRPQGLTNRQIGVRAGLSSRSGTFSTYISRGRTQGWIEGRGTLVITTAGREALGNYEALPTGDALLAYWLGELGNSGASRLLRAIADAYPRALSNAEAAEAAGLSHRSGTFSTYVSKLRTLQLIEGRGELSASEELFS